MNSHLVSPGSSLPSAFVLWIMRELPPLVAINVPEEPRTLTFVSDYSATSQPQHWTTITTAQNQVQLLYLSILYNLFNFHGRPLSNYPYYHWHIFPISTYLSCLYMNNSLKRYSSIYLLGSNLQSYKGIKTYGLLYDMFCVWKSASWHSLPKLVHRGPCKTLLFKWCAVRGAISTQLLINVLNWVVLYLKRVESSWTHPIFPHLEMVRWSTTRIFIELYVNRSRDVSFKECSALVWTAIPQFIEVAILTFCDCGLCLIRNSKLWTARPQFIWMLVLHFFPAMSIFLFIYVQQIRKLRILSTFNCRYQGQVLYNCSSASI